MRLRAGLCGLSLAFLAGCEMVPQILRIEVDDRVIEVKPKPSPAMPASNETEPEPELESGPSLPRGSDDPEPR